MPIVARLDPPRCHATRLLGMDGTITASGDTVQATEALIAQLEARLASDQLPLPTLPDLALRIDAIVGAPDSGAAAVAVAINQDPATAARLIAAANSAYAASRVRVQSTQAAVTRLGLAYTRALVRRIALEQMFLAQRPELQQLARHCWNRSLAVAALSEALARCCTDLPADTAMTAGLLHRIGVLPLIRLLDEDVAPDTVIDADVIAAALAPRAGQRLLRHWGFAGLFQEIPEIAADPGYRHRGPAELGDVVLAAGYGAALAEGEAAVAPAEALAKLRLAADGSFLTTPAIHQAHEAALTRLTC